MTELQAALVMILFFALRCMLPLFFTLAIGYVMNRLVSRWQAEEEAAAHVAEPCWKTKNCPPEKRENCPSYYQTGTPCWQVRAQISGALPETCHTCPLYHPQLTPPAPAF